jgi:hypothetical protein
VQLDRITWRNASASVQRKSGSEDISGIGLRELSLGKETDFIDQTGKPGCTHRATREEVAMASVGEIHDSSQWLMMLHTLSPILREMRNTARRERGLTSPFCAFVRAFSSLR